MRRTLLVGLGVLALGCAAAGCGGSSSNGVASKSPSQILQTAVAAMKSAKSVHMAGTIIQSAKTITVDMTIYANSDVDGTFDESGSTVSIVKIGPTDYIKTTSGFYQAQGASAQVAGLMGGKWLKIPDSTAGLGSSFSLVGLASSITNSHDKVSAGKTSTVNGQAVVSVIAANNGTLYVATTGTAYPVEVTKGSSGTITFTQWDQAKTPTAPAGARTPASFG
jgi:hypothetical protein